MRYKHTCILSLALRQTLAVGGGSVNIFNRALFMKVTLLTYELDVYDMANAAFQSGYGRTVWVHHLDFLPPGY